MTKRAPSSNDNDGSATSRQAADAAVSAPAEHVIAEAPPPGDLAHALADRRTGWFTRDLIEALPAAVYVCDATGAVVDYNRRAAELWGRAPRLDAREARYCGARRLYRPDGTDLPHDRSPVALVLDTGEKTLDTELVVERPDGSRVTVTSHAVPLFDDEGRIAGAVNCVHDVTARKRSTEALHQSRKLAALGQLTGGVAHDFSNVLATIVLNLNLIENRIGDSAIVKFVYGAIQAASRGSALVERLLAFAGRQHLDLAATDLDALVAGMRDVVLRTVGPAVAVDVRPGDGLWPALVDPNQVELAILHLVANARDAMPSGGSLTIRTANFRLAAPDAELAAGDYVMLSISDTGHGMPDEVLARALEPFFTTRESGRSAGLGLSMVLGMAKQHGGTARIESRVGRGTRVDLVLPRAAAIGLRPADGENRARHADGPTERQAVLVVDDDPNLCAVVVEALGGFGFEVLHADSGRAALEIVRSRRTLDLMLVDYAMADLNGLEVVRHARAIRPELKATVMTGHVEMPGLQAGENPTVTVLRKPFRATDVVAHIHRVTRQHGSADRAPPAMPAGGVFGTFGGWSR